jgi:beta-fructofuranosidase
MKRRTFLQTAGAAVTSVTLGMTHVSLQGGESLIDDGAAPKDPTTPSNQTAFLYQPETGVLADVIPFCWKDQFHLLYLQLKPGQKGFDWAQLVTRDFVSFEYTGTAIPSGGTDDAVDLDVFTGSVFEKDGTLYAFYAGHNGEFGKQHKPDQVLLRATSRDGLTWTKDPQFRFSPDGDARYHWPGACRDPFLFWNPERNEVGMLFTATPTNAPMGGLAYAGSTDLEHWQLGDPQPSSGRFSGYECPDLFRMGDRWYLLFSTYWQNPGWATRYMTAPSLDGPWESPADDFFDGGSLYAAKSVSDGTRRFLCGTLPRREPNRDDGDNGWSGRLLVYELHCREDGSLGVRLPPEIENSFGQSVPVNLPEHPSWLSTANGVRAVSGPARAHLGRLPSRSLLSARLTVPPTGRAGFWLGGDAAGEQAFRLYLDVGTQRLLWDRGILPIGSNPEKERPYRPIRIQPGDNVVLKVAIDGDAATACVNDTTCLATRLYDRGENTFGIWSDTAGAEFHEVRLQS